MAEITLILGGARSGKSNFALGLAKSSKGRVAFIATCQPKDKEMKQRIALHKKSRPGHWKTFQEPRDIQKTLKTEGNKFDFILIDCLTLLVSNLLCAGYSQAAIEQRINSILEELKVIKSNVVIVSNEVGLGIVPANKLGRDFRDIAGKINQVVAKAANEVFFMVSGLPLKVK